MSLAVPEKAKCEVCKVTGLAFDMCSSPYQKYKCRRCTWKTFKEIQPLLPEFEDIGK